MTVGRVRHKLANPFFVLATQNPIEQEGTYPLPEAQQDRFMFKVFVKYPTFNEEFEIARRTTGVAADEITPVLTGEQILELQKLVRKVPVTDHVIHYSLALVRQTRVGEPGVPKFIKRLAELGRRPAGGAEPDPRRQGPGAAVRPRRTSPPRTSRRWRYPVLRHRILTNFTAASEGITTDTVVKKLLEETPEKEGDLTSDERFKKIFAS